jgi:hypothetical protein
MDTILSSQDLGETCNDSATNIANTLLAFSAVCHRLVRNIAWTLDNYVHTFSPKWGTVIGGLPGSLRQHCRQRLQSSAPRLDTSVPRALLGLMLAG